MTFWTLGMEWAFEVSRKASAAGAAVYLFQWRIGFWSPTLSELVNHGGRCWKHFARLVDPPAPLSHRKSAVSRFGKNKKQATSRVSSGSPQ